MNHAANVIGDGATVDWRAHFLCQLDADVETNDVALQMQVYLPVERKNSIYAL